MDLKLNINSFGNQLEMLLEKKDFLEAENPLLTSIRLARYNNPWFTEEAVCSRLKYIALWLKTENFNFLFKKNPANIGVISEERFPLEEFASLIYILLSGNFAYYKSNEKSDKVLKHLIEWMVQEIPGFKDKIVFCERFPAKIDNYYISSREEKPELEKSYFLAKNVLFEARRQSVAIISGNENDDELKLLAGDIFNFFGQASANVKKLFIPENFDIRRIYEPFQEFYRVLDHHPYANNYQYQQSVYLMNRIPHYDNGFLLLREEKSDRAPTGVLYYETYNEFNILVEQLSQKPFYRIYTSGYMGQKMASFGSSGVQDFNLSSQFLQFLL